jgi:hypothetical protein
MSWNDKEEIETQKFLNPMVAGFARVLSALNLLKTKDALFKDPVRTAQYTCHLGYKNQSVYAVSGASRCLFSD